jgi:heterotetrameric sarcosine oxidase gamma subunit
MTSKAGRRKEPSALQQSGVESHDFHSETLSLAVLQNTSFIRVHSLSENPLSADCSIKLPDKTGQCSDQNPRVLCLRPRDWLVVSDSSRLEELLQQLDEVTDSNATAVLNASDSFTTFRVARAAAPWLLGKLSGLDFLTEKNKGPHCAQTKIGHVAVIVHYHQPAGGDYVFDLILDRSIAKYLWSLMIESADHAEELNNNYGN